MLVLSRKVGQELVIGENIRITINRVSGSRVTLGISAPADVRIVRGELTPIVTAFEGSSESPSTASAAEKSEELEDTEPVPVSSGSTWTVLASNEVLEMMPPAR